MYSWASSSLTLSLHDALPISVRQLSQSRAIALDMESATIAANGFRFRVPYGTLLCVSDKPLHGELKLPGMASADRKSTRLNSSHVARSYAGFCLKKKTNWTVQ